MAPGRRWWWVAAAGIAILAAALVAVPARERLPRPPAAAPPAPPTVATGGILPLAIESFPPFEYERDGAIVGFDAEIVQQVLARLGLTARIEVLPWARAQEEAAAGRIAGLFSLTWSPERERLYHFSAPLSTVKDVFFKLRTREFAWRELDDLKGLRVGISQGYAYAPELMRAIQAGSIATDVVAGENPEYRHFTKLASGRIDLCVCEVSVGLHLIRTHAPEFDGIDFIDRPIGPVRPYHLGFSRRWPGAEALAARFNAELARFESEGGRQAALRRYGAADPATGPALNAPR